MHSSVIALLVAELLALISLSLQPAQIKPPSEIITLESGWEKETPAEAEVPVAVANNVAPKPVPQIPVAEKAEVQPDNVRSLRGSEVQDLVQQAATSAQGRTAEENQQTLEELTGTLNNVSNDKSLDGLMNSLNNVFQTSPRAEQPAAEPVAGDFDFDTAQIHDVKREELADGRFRYTAILLDAEGRTLDSEMDEIEGARVFEVMALIKQNPLLEKLYRGMLMSLFDKMMKPGSDDVNAKLPSAAIPTSAADPKPEVKPNSPQPGVPFDPFAE